MDRPRFSQKVHPGDNSLILVTKLLRVLHHYHYVLDPLPTGLASRMSVEAALI